MLNQNDTGYYPCAQKWRLASSERPINGGNHDSPWDFGGSQTGWWLTYPSEKYESQLG